MLSLPAIDLEPGPAASVLNLAFERLHLEWIQVSADQRHFVGEQTGRRFAPLGFNYDHDEYFRLLEDYWHREWQKVENDFITMRTLGANTIRIHLQLGKFLQAAGQANETEFAQLDRLVGLAKSVGVYLDLVGLCCYRKEDVPDWYHNMDYRQRWEVQAFFWKTLAARYADEPAIFCYDIMNEPVVPGRKRQPGAWLGSEFAGKSYIQFITLDGTERPRDEIALDWLQCMKQGIRSEDARRLVTVGLVDWSLRNSSIKSGFFPDQVVQHVDFISAHLYPQHGKVAQMLKTLQGFCVGKPVVIGETFHMKCTVEEEELFLQRAAKHAQGFLGFYTDFMPEPADADEHEQWRNGRRRVHTEWHGIFDRCAPFYKRRR